MSEKTEVRQTVETRKDLNGVWITNQNLRAKESLQRADSRKLEGFINTKAREIGINEDTLAIINHNPREARLLRDTMVNVLDLKPEAKTIFLDKIKL